MQGKIPAAIQEYQKILDKEPRDLEIMNQIGDLYLRLNKTEEALKYFYKLGEAYLDDGFTRKAIAVYKKITRSDAEAIDAVARLGELYTMQGQLNDARAHYQQAAEHYSKRNDAAKCTDIYEKLLMLDPESLPVKQRLAGLYEQANRRDEAAAMYFGAAEGQADRGNPTDAEKALRKARDLGMFGPDVLVLQARILVDTGRGPEAIQSLRQIPNVDSNKAALNLLFHAHMAAGDRSAASEVAMKLFEHFDDFAGLEQVSAGMLEGGERDEVLSIYERVADRLVTQRNTDPLVDSLKRIISADPAAIRARELLVHVHEGTGETGELSEALEQLAEALARQGDYERAHSLFSRLAEMEPTHEQHRIHLRQMEEKLGRAPAPRIEMGAPAIAEEFMPELQQPSAPAVPKEEELDAESQELLNNAITESDLLVTYKQYQKALGPLEQALETLPRNITLNQRLADLYERTGRWEQAAQRCEVLTEAFVVIGDGENATRYGDMLAKFREKAGAAAPPAAPEAPAEMPMGFPAVEEVSSAPAVEVGAEAGETTTREVDLSAEWESMVAPPAAAPPAAAPVENLVEEVEFYLQAEMVGEAGVSLEKLRAAAPSDSRLEGLQARLEQAVAGSMAAPAAPPEEAAAATTQVFEFPGAAVEEAAAPAPPVAAPAAPAPPPPAKEEELALGLETPAAEAGEFELALEETEAPAAPKAAAPAAPAGMGDLVGALEEELSGLGAPPTPAAKPSAPPPKAGPPPAQAPGALADVFAEFKEGMEEAEAGIAAEADIETHYNMGVAFKEMGLLDEAIGEFQKAYEGAERLPNYPNFIPCCSLLAHCFIEKNLPDLAVKWLEKALKAPGIDRQGEVALRYEIGSAQEMAGNTAAALNSFMEVYSLNIDYRDVADRIRALKSK